MRADWTDDPEGWFWAAAAAMSEPGGAADARGPELSASGFGGLRGLLDDEPEDRDPLGLPYCDDPAQAAADDAARRRADDAARAAAAAGGSADALDARRLAALEAARRAGAWSGAGVVSAAGSTLANAGAQWGAGVAFLPPVPVPTIYAPIVIGGRFAGWKWQSPRGWPSTPWPPGANTGFLQVSALWYRGEATPVIAYTPAQTGNGEWVYRFNNSVNAYWDTVVSTSPIPAPPTDGPTIRYHAPAPTAPRGTLGYYSVLTPTGWVDIPPAAMAQFQADLAAGRYNLPGAVVPASPWPEPGTVAPSPVIVDPIAAGEEFVPAAGSSPIPSGGSIPVAAFVVQATGAARANYPRPNSISNRGIPLAGFGQRPARGLGCGACGGNCSRRRGVPGSR